MRVLCEGPVGLVVRKEEFMYIPMWEFWCCVDLGSWEPRPQITLGLVMKIEW